MQELKSAILAIFQNGLGWLCLVSAALNNLLQEFKILFVLGADQSLERLESKTRKGSFFQGLT